MNISIILVFVCQLFIGTYATRVTSSTTGTLTNSRLERVFHRIENKAAKMVIKRTYLQCSTGIRNTKTDIYCRKLALIMYRHEALIRRRYNHLRNKLFL